MNIQFSRNSEPARWPALCLPAIACALLLTACGQEPPASPDVAAARADSIAVSDAQQSISGIPGNQAVYITMPDGVRIAAEIWLPDGLTSADTLPTLISFTRYWRAPAYDPPQTGKSELFAGLNAAGYAAVVVDTRGSGASYGSRASEFSVCETRDFKYVIDWVAEQSWSNSRVATIGVSYSGNTAEHASFDPSPALRATIPRFTDFDGYYSILYPGGLKNRLITDTWGAAVRELDNNAVSAERAAPQADGSRLLGVRPVDIDTDGTLLDAAVKEHASNMDLTTFFADLNYRDEIQFARSLDESSSDDCAEMVSPYRFRTAVESNNIPSFHWGSWVDAGTASGVLARFTRYKAPARYIIGPWTHGAGADAGVFKPADTAVEPSVEGQYGAILEFLEPLMRGNGEVDLSQPSLSYFTMGEDRWKTTDIWPPAGHSEVSWHLDENHQLSSPPAKQDGSDDYAVDFEAGTGAATRWTTQLGGQDIFHGDRAKADQRLLTYTSPPLETDTEITGHARVELYVSSTHEDGALIAYLETVAPNGVVTMITEGELRLIHRKVSDETPPYPMFGPYHSYERGDAEAMVPGEVSKVEFVMWPTSVLVPAGHALRLAIAGHDKDTFARYPAEGNPVLTLHRSTDHPSRLVIPVIQRH